MIYPIPQEFVEKVNQLAKEAAQRPITFPDGFKGFREKLKWNLELLKFCDDSTIQTGFCKKKPTYQEVLESARRGSLLNDFSHWDMKTITYVLDVVLGVTEEDTVRLYDQIETVIVTAESSPSPAFHIVNNHDNQ